jgi:5-formyltetrahydrofolate cyclo-ligase
MKTRLKGRVFIYNEHMNAKKEALRKQLLAKRRLETPVRARLASESIVTQLPSLLDWVNAKSVHVYTSLPSLGELDTVPLIEWLQREQPQVAITVGVSTANIPFPSEKYDVIFVPVLGFDRGGFRLGMGGGWYDRWLATQPQAHTIGLAYAWAEVEDMPHEPHDIPLKQILTA